MNPGFHPHVTGNDSVWRERGFVLRYLDGSLQAGLLNAQHNQSRHSDAVKEVVDEAHIVDEGINVAGAQHQQSGGELQYMWTKRVTHISQDRGQEPWTKLSLRPGLTVTIKAGMGVQRVV